MKDRYLNLAPVATIVGIVVVWELATRVMDIPRFLLPAPSDIVSVAYEARWRLLEHMRVTLTQTVVGYLFSVSVAIPLAVAIVYSRVLERAIYPLLVGNQAIPTIAVAPLLLLWLGFGMRPKIAVIFLIAIFPLTINAATGLRATPREFIELSRSLCASSLQIFWRVRFPAALPNIFVGLKIGVALAVVGSVVGEFTAADRGLGYLILLSSGQARTSMAFASIFLLAIMSVTLFYGVVLLERLSVPWGRFVHE